jgi:hypothetical protein
MNIRLASAFACFSLPFFAHADLIDYLQVRYSGTVNEVSRQGDGGHFHYDVGDRISGALFVDLRRAPMDSSPNPNVGVYSYYPSPGGPSFVGGHAPPRSTSADRVYVGDDDAGRDYFQLSDTEFGYNAAGPGRRTFRFDALTLDLVGATGDFTQSDGLSQAFQIRGDSIGTGMVETDTQQWWGEKLLKSFGGTAKFVLDFFSVKPGTCSA